MRSIKMMVFPMTLNEP